MNLNGIIPVNKPKGFTSFDVIAKMRGILKMKKLGHAGTLDPDATGVLPVFVGFATKACDILPCHDKTYEAEFRLGITTDTQDISGKVLSERECNGVTEDILRDVLADFRGEIQQIPPMYSAVSVGGKRLYELARKGVEIEREARTVNILRLELLSFDESTHTGKLEVRCSKGTYIRTLINDIGERLSCGAAMTALVRTEAAGFTLDDCVTLEELQNTDDFTEVVIPIERVFSDYPKIELNKDQTRMYKNGVRLDLARVKNSRDSEIFSVCGEGEFLGIARADREKNLLVGERNFYDR